MKYFKSLLVTMSLMFSSLTVHATLINLDVSDLGGDAYQFNFEVTNNTTASLEGLTFWLDAAVFDEFTVSNISPDNSDWDPLVFNSFAPSFPDFAVDYYALGTGLAIDGIQTFSFKVKSTVGTINEANSLVEVYDPNTFDVLESLQVSWTSSASKPIPEPMTFLLLTLGVLLISGFKVHRRLILVCSPVIR